MFVFRFYSKAILSAEVSDEFSPLKGIPDNSVLPPFCSQMIADSIRRFAQENFSDKYFPILHGETGNVKPLALVVKQRRSIWKRPFAKLEMVILAGLERYVVSGTEEAFLESVKSKITKEELLKTQKVGMGSSSHELRVEISGHVAEGTFKSSDDQGVLKLGNLSQNYISDPDLRAVLANAELDANKMKDFENQELLLATSVIYSEKFVLRGKRKRQVEMPPFVQILIPHLKAHCKGTYIPPEVASRTVQAPFLFKCCRVGYNKEANRLEIRKGEYVGKTITAALGNETTMQDDAYGDSLPVEICIGEDDELEDSLTTEDIEKLDIIKKEVLLEETTLERRKARVNQYVQWFERALTTGQNVLLLDEPLTSKDCRFLKSINLPSSRNSTRLDLSSFSKEDIQGYGIVFKVLSELPDEQWSELEMKLDE